jgi:lysophospholipase L1-like esterase
VEWGIRDSVITNEIAPLVRLLVRRNKQKLIDLNILFPNDKNLLLDDGVHPNVDGSKRLAEIICNEIKRKEL